MKKTLTILGAALFLAACGADDSPNLVVGELASERIELTAEFNEPVVEIVVAEGDTVAAGDRLLRLNDARSKARLAGAEAALLQARARLAELTRGPRSEQISAARATLDGATREQNFRQGEVQRIREIHSRGLASPDVLDRTNAALDAAQANFKLRQAQLEELLAGTTIEALAQAEQLVSQAAAKRDAAAIDVDRHTLLAPVDGVVDSRLFEIGERPGLGQPTIIMLGGDQPYARVYVPEQLRVQIRTGTSARIFVDGLKDPLPGRVRWVASEAAFTPYYALTERDRGRLTYVAKIDFTNTQERLPDGIPVEVEFQLD